MLGQNKIESTLKNHVLGPHGRQANVSKQCPKCSSGNITMTTGINTPLFDENGWYYPVSMACKSIRCQNEWTEKIIVVQGGFHSVG